ncbi:hypothetical protein VTL71DRAFT_6705, partial [Oculimacula yallundae]
MVYQGPSKGCNSCRQRRKKCDETRPSCMRCMNAKRQCGGYEADVMGYRHYGAPSTSNQSSSQVSTARKCTLPKRVPIPGTDILPEDKIPSETTLEESKALSLRAFYYDFCITSTNQNLSRGFLPGLERMVNRLGPKSDLAKVCQAVACACHSKPQHRPQFVKRADTSYQQLLGSLARKIENTSSAVDAESRLVAMLLGLYQMVIADKTDPGVHEIHAKGLSTLMKIENSPLSFLRPSIDFSSQGLLKIDQGPGIFSVPTLSTAGPSLDDLLLDLDTIWHSFQASASLQDLSKLDVECTHLERRFGEWQKCRVQEFRPVPIRKIDYGQDNPEFLVGYWPGTVDTYIDLYVAGVWNIFRTARLLLFSIQMQIYNLVGNNEQCSQAFSTAIQMVEHVFASIPYQLADNLPVFIDGIDSRAAIDPGKSIGGLLLMHPLYAISKMPFLPVNMRQYARNCLIWIGGEMGIGQAGLMAEVIEVILVFY